MASRILSTKVFQLNCVVPSLSRRVDFPTPRSFTPIPKPKHFHRSAIACFPNDGKHGKEAISFNIQDEDDFKERVVKSSVPVAVDFHASWCGPCKILGPRLETKISQLKGNILLAKVDIDDLSDLAVEFKVSAVPTVVGMKNGKEVERFLGVLDDDQLDSFLRKIV